MYMSHYEKHECIFRQKKVSEMGKYIFSFGDYSEILTFAAEFFAQVAE